MAKEYRDSEKIKCIKELYTHEMLHAAVFKRLAAMERNAELKRILAKLVSLEAKHKEMWGRILEINKVKRPRARVAFYVGSIILVRKIFGLALAVKTIEYFEEQLHRKLGATETKTNLSEKEARIIHAIDNDEHTMEGPLEAKIVEYGTILTNIRDVAFGMNDGLVEILAVVAGFGAALRTPLLIAIAGFIVAISGTLSMAGGAYISTEYEASVTGVTGGENHRATPLRSAFFVGVPYFIGSLLPLLPFLLGMSGTGAVAVAVLLTMAALTVISAIISIVSNSDMLKRITRTLMISLGAAAITIILGYYARTAFNLAI
jgi:VIT1/CCC1 family predicted Fe2+/Mn2+ transporter